MIIFWLIVFVVWCGITHIVRKTIFKIRRKRAIRKINAEIAKQIARNKEIWENHIKSEKYLQFRKRENDFFRRKEKASNSPCGNMDGVDLLTDFNGKVLLIFYEEKKRKQLKKLCNKCNLLSINFGRGLYFFLNGKK